MNRLFGFLRRTTAPVPTFTERVGFLRELLHANNAALGFLARIQQALESESPCSIADVRRLVTGVTVQTYRMITNLNRMTANRYPALVPKFEGIKSAVARRVEIAPTLMPVGQVVPLERVDLSLAEAVGQKSAYLGEARRILAGHVPAGFATTQDAYRAFLMAAGLGERIAGATEDLSPGDVPGCFAVSARITQMIESAAVPDELARSIQDAVARLPGCPSLRLAVRSSALQEGGLGMSFAGQYRSMLNIPPDGVVEAFRQVVASKYSPQAIAYRLGRGYADDEVAMGCCVLTMIDAAAAGVVYSSFRTSAGRKTLLQAVRGLGLSAVDGSVEPDSFILDASTARVIEVRYGRQPTLIRAAPIAGTEKVRLTPTLSAEGVVTIEQAVEVGRLTWRLESALGMPIDVEWAIDRAGRVFILQVRPLSDVTGDAGTPRTDPIAGEHVLVAAGSRASGGAGAGSVCRVESDLDILRCPARAVVVTREANPRFAVLLPRAAAVVADMGEVTGHLATVARELGVPALFATRVATERLHDGDVVTVDADAGVVYAGRVEQALAATAPRSSGAKRDANRELLRSVSEFIVPLTLRGRLASGYAPRRCRTLHDFIRFCHQAGIEAMFALGDRALRAGQPLSRLVSNVPIDCRVVDLGRGLKAGVDASAVTLDDVACRPMVALWRGMTDPRLRWRHLRPMSLRGFVSALVNYNIDDDASMRRLGEPSYAFITDEYLNLNSRIGYHFTTVDARVSDTPESNYASFRFVGGATGIVTRSRRAVLIEHLLARSGFETDCRADLVNARIRHRQASEMEDALVRIGLVIGYVNHLDMALVSDASVTAYEEAFLAGDYGFLGAGEHGPEEETRK